MTDTQTILACPACGYTAAVYDYKAMSAVYCEDCGAMGPLGETDYEAIEKWNAMPRAVLPEPNDVDCKGCPRNPCVLSKYCTPLAENT